jgi:hypothetical protein
MPEQKSPTYWTIEDVIRAVSDPKLSIGAKKAILIAFRDHLSVEDMERIALLWRKFEEQKRQ